MLGFHLGQRQWEIFNNINVDRAEAEKIRNAWLSGQRPALPLPTKPLHNLRKCCGQGALFDKTLSGGKKDPSGLRKIRLHFGMGLGDAVAGTTCIANLMEQHPDKFAVAVCGEHVEAVFAGNPYVSKFQTSELIIMKYPLVDSSNGRPVSMLQGFTDYLSAHLDIPILTTNRPYLYHAAGDPNWDNWINWDAKPVWLLNCSVKPDINVKKYPFERWQQIVDGLPEVQFIQVGKDEWTPYRCSNVIDMVGKTTTRELIMLACRADGAVTLDSALWWIMAGWQKRAVCIASGNAPLSWIMMPTGTIVSRATTLPCCFAGGCWRQIMQKCEMPVGDVGECMHRIPAAEVISAIKRYID